MAKTATKWPKIITVDKNIIKILSESTYENFPNALKEVIINAYDALATEVSITVDLKNENITISDNGIGMDEADYDFYLRIAGKRREKKELTKSSRQKIGQFGVGFLSVFPFFKTYAIETKKGGMKQALYATIPCSQYFDSNNKLIHINDIKIIGGLKNSSYSENDHFTIIKLSGFTTITKDFFFPLVDIKVNKYSIKNPHYFSTTDKLKWLLCEDLPLKFEDNDFNSLFNDYSENLPFKVLFNTQELLRKVYAKNILEKHKNPYSELGRIKFQYFISTDKEAIRPYEARFLKIRNLNVGVGERETFVGKDVVAGGYPRLQQLTGEIYILEGMNDIIKVSRDGFNYSTDYESLKAFFAKKLVYHSSKLQEEDNIAKAKSPKKIRALKYVRPIANLKKKKQPKIFEKGQVIKKTIEEDSTSTLEVEGRRFYVESDKWNFKGDKFPACKIHGNSLVINSKYPLFKGVKHTDVFIKLHVFLLLNLERKNISEASYKKMANEVLFIYEDYWKNKNKPL